MFILRMRSSIHILTTQDLFAIIAVSTDDLSRMEKAFGSSLASLSFLDCDDESVEVVVSSCVWEDLDLG